MALTDLQRLRLYLNDRTATPVFSDEELNQLLTDAAGEVAAAAAAGWILKAATAVDRPTALQLGKRSATGPGAQSQYAICMRMARHWQARMANPAGLAQIFSVRPDVGLVADLLDHRDTVADDEPVLEDDLTRIW